MPLTAALVALQLALAAPGVAGATAGPAPPIPSGRLRFAKDTGAAEIRGAVRGREVRDFALRAGAGQQLEVELRSDSPSLNFNVLSPGSEDVAMFIGSISGARFQGVAPIAGDYVLRVYLVRSAARRNVAAPFTLAARVSGPERIPLAASEDARVPGTPFHASARVSCALPYRPEVRECDASVIRYDREGTATVELRGPRGFLRRILFVSGRPVASDATEPLGFTRDGETTTVRFGDDERFEVPDALLIGG